MYTVVTQEEIQCSLFYILALWILPSDQAIFLFQVDLNRDFPSWTDFNKTREDLLANRAPETQSMMKYILDNPFVISLNIHDGSVVASYPFDDLKVCAVETGLFSLYSNRSISLYSNRLISDIFKPWVLSLV